ncbi:indolepyruvate oxidoreductase subunit beta [Pontibacterium sp. N1Y112]|uniref:Indolepyruvate oxidoreductase subunit beta n=1 Tax=Pontibacterium sinense TaxID=2781979 RepID=A0A8J7F7U0_9GAMM|nr:indolepyruvate oxidoreductase subunit beta [Pontibacterium sinense]
MNNEVTNILVVGIGGQGVMTAADILATSALSLGYDVKKTEVAGMAQRGGVVTSHVRFGPKVYSPAIQAGDADLMLAFEPAEALRWASHLKDNGLAMVNTFAQEPPVVSIGLFDYPDEPIEKMRKMGVETHDYNAGQSAIDLGDRRLVNSIMLGAISDRLPFPAGTIENSLTARFKNKGEALLALNHQAFELGRKAFS